MNLETKITIYKFTPQVFTLTPHFKLKTEFPIKYIYKPLETKNRPIGRLI